MNQVLIADFLPHSRIDPTARHQHRSRANTVSMKLALLLAVVNMSFLSFLEDRAIHELRRPVSTSQPKAGRLKRLGGGAVD